MVVNGVVFCSGWLCPPHPPEFFKASGFPGHFVFEKAPLIVKVGDCSPTQAKCPA